MGFLGPLAPRLCVLCWLALMALSMAAAGAAELEWDVTAGNGQADGGSGTWISGGAGWWDTAGASDASFVDGDSVAFGGTAGTVTVSGSVATPSITITAGYIFTGGASDSIEIGGGTIDSSVLGTTGGTAVTMNAVLAGTGGLTINAHGNLSSSGGGSGAQFRLGNGNGNGNTFSGGLTIGGGLVSWTDDASFGDASNAITLANLGGLLDANQSQTLSRDLVIDATGGTIRTYGNSTLTLAGQISGAGDINRTDGGTLIVTNAANTHSGTWNLQGGILRVNGGGSLGTASINNGTRVDFFNDGTAGTYTNGISGAGGIRFESVAGTTYAGTINITGNLQVGDVTNGAAVTFASGADVTAGNLWLGESGSVAGNVTQEAGTTIEVTNQFRVGHWPNNTSTYTMTGGSLTLSGTPGSGFETPGVVILGIDGTGIFNQTGGTVTAAGVGLDLRSNTGGTDQYNLDGGTLILGSKGIGGNSSSEFNLGGGTLQASADFTSTKAWNLVADSVLDAAGYAVTQQGDITGSANLQLTAATGSLTLDTSGTQSIAAPLTGVGAVTKTGSGTTTLAGASTYTGATTVSAGTLAVTGSLGTTAVTVADAAAIAGEGSLGGSLTLGSVSGSTIVVDPSTPGSLAVAGSVTLNATNTVSLTSKPAPGSGPVAVFSHGGLTGTLGTNLVVADVGNYRTPVWSDVGGLVSVDLDSRNLTWNGAGGGAWDVKTSSRWNASDADQFAWGDAVTFDDTGVTTAIALTGELQPYAVTVDSDTNTYSFTGSTGNVIAGSASLLKRGTSTLTIDAPNTFTGGTTISQGTIVMTGTNGGFGSGGITLGDASTGDADVAVLITNARGVGNAITVSDQGTGNAIIGFSGTGGSYTAFTGNIEINRDVILRSGTTDRLHFSGGLSGTGNVTIDGGQRVTFAGTKTFDGDLLLRDSGTVFQTFSTNLPDDVTVDVGPGAIFQVYTSEAIGAVTGSGILRPIAANPTLTVGGGDVSGDFAGTWVRSGSNYLNITKTGTGTQTFSGPIDGAPGVLTVNGGAVDFTGTAVFGRRTSPNTGNIVTRAIQGSGTVGTSGSGSLLLRRSGDGFTGTLAVAGGTLTVAHPDAAGSGGLALSGGTLAFSNAGSYFTVLGGTTLSGGTLTTDVTTDDYGTMHNTSGDVVPDSTTHAYHGRIWLTAGEWSFAKKFDDGGSVTIDGTEVLNNATWSATATGSYTAASDGWYDIDVRVNQGGGGVGPNGDWTKGIGIKQGAATADNADYEAFGDGVLGTRLTTASGLTISGDVSLSGSPVVDTAAMVGTPGATGGDGNGLGGDVTFSGIVSGTGTLVKNGTGSLLLTNAANTFSGGIEVNGGAIAVSDDANLGATSGGITLAGGGLELAGSTTLAATRTITAATGTSSILSVAAGQVVSFAGDVTGSGDLDKAGAGSLSLGGASAGYTGNFTISAGTLELTAANAFANAASLTQTGGRLLLNPTGVTEIPLPDLSGENGEVEVGSGITAEIGGPGNQNYGGRIRGAGGMRKQGTGRFVLTGDNDYTGPTDVNQGRLIVNGRLSGTSRVDVRSGAALGGTGTIDGFTAIEAGGTHAPGGSPGLQTFTAGLDYGSSAVFEWELSANTAQTGDRGTLFDAVDVTGGNLSIDSAAVFNLVFDSPLADTTASTVDWTDTFWDSDHSWTVIDFSGGGTSSGLFTLGSIGNDINGIALATARPNASFSVVRNGDDVDLTYVAVPEPATLALAALAAAAALAGSRRMLD
jgi:fibronectin-binding autotransporter adhesin